MHFHFWKGFFKRKKFELRDLESRSSNRFLHLPTSQASRGSRRCLPSTLFFHQPETCKKRSQCYNFIFNSHLFENYVKIPENDQSLFTVAGNVCVLLLLLQLIFCINVVLNRENLPSPLLKQNPKFLSFSLTKIDTITKITCRIHSFSNSVV